MLEIKQLIRSIFKGEDTTEAPPGHTDDDHQHANATSGSDAQININRIYTLAIIVCLVFLIGGIAFVNHANDLSKENTISYIREATRQTKLAIEEHIKEEFDTLMATAVITQNEDLLDDNDALRALQQGLVSHNAYTIVGYANTNGKASWIDKEERIHHGDLSSEVYVKRPLKGETVLSKEQFDDVSRMMVYYYAVPVYDESTNEIKGVLFAADPRRELRNIINRSLYAGKGLAHIIDSNGKYILQSDSPLFMGTGDNIFEIPNPLDKDEENKIIKDLHDRTSSQMEKSFYGENRLVAYAPLNINDWSVFYAVPENMVDAGLRTLTMGAALIVCTATCVFVFFILLIQSLNNRNRKALEQLAFVDPVTGQRNYQKFLIDAEGILKNSNGTHYAMCYSDIKGFKYVNDIFGRDVGDSLLKYYAEIQKNISQEGEIAGHISADTFVALRKFQSRQDIEKRFESCAHLVSVFPETFSQGYRIDLFGGAYMLCDIEKNLTINDMLDRAISAQKEVKYQSGSKRFAFYTNEMREEKLWEADIEAKMETALENDEFKVYLQPKIDIQHNDSIMGAEALIRWDSPEYGLVPPGRFIDLFERNGFILKLDKFVFEKACEYYKNEVLSGNLSYFVMSVNVSRLGMVQPDFVRTYSEIKDKYGIPDKCIELEFTESLAVENYKLLKTVVADCKRSGFTCSMDDFGSGYSSLNMLKSIHVDVLKIDRQFFIYEEDIERGEELVKIIIMMAKAMDMKTIAEGIDEEEQVKQLREMGCDAVQGFIFSKPIPINHFERFMETWHGN